MLLRCPAGRVDPTPDDPRFSLILANSPPDLGGELDMDSPDGGDFSAVGPELVRPATALAFAGGVLVALDDALDDDLDDVESVDAGRDPLDWTEFMDVFRWNVMPSNWLISSPQASSCSSSNSRKDRSVGGGFEDVVLPVMRFQKPPAFFSPLLPPPPPPPPPPNAPFGVVIAAQIASLFLFSVGCQTG